MPPLAAVPDLDRELDELYSLPLEDFTRTRNDLVRRLKRAHQSAAAATVQSLRKPTLAAWAVNRLARSERDLVGALLQAGESLRDTQARALAGDAKPGEIQGALAAEREAVHALAASASDLLAGRVSTALLDRISQTLHAAAVDQNTRRLLERGRLVEDMRAVGFGPLSSVPAISPNREEQRIARQARLKTLRAEARRLTKIAFDAERAADDAGREARRLREEAESRRRAADEAAVELANAENEPA